MKNILNKILFTTMYNRNLLTPVRFFSVADSTNLRQARVPHLNPLKIYRHTRE